MKHEVFKKYVTRIAEAFRINEDELFVKTKEQKIVDARYLLYYLCHNRPMGMKYIIDYMGDYGYDVNYSTIMYGIKIAKKKISEDMDYADLAMEINFKV